MKKVFFLSLISFLGFAGFSQQSPLYSLNFENRFIYNPARTGFNGNPELYLIYRKQWLDFNGAPETRAASFDMRVKKGGFGFYVFNDITDVFRTWGGYFSYAYHLDFNDMHHLSIGLSAGLQDYSFDMEKAVIKDQNDPLLMGDRGISFDGSAGLHYFVTKGSLLNLSLGLSALSVYSTDMKFLNDAAPSTLFVPDRHYLGTLSNTFKLADEKLIIEPIVMSRLTEALNYQIDAGAKVGYKDWVWVSGMYRYDYGVTIGGGFKVHDAVKLAYAYDLAMNDIKDYTKGSHEIMLGIVFGKKKDKELATKEEVDKIKEKLMLQDSLFHKMQDSLYNRIDSLQGQVDSLSEVLSTGEFVTEPEGDYDEQMLKDIDNLSEDEWKEKYGEEEYQRYKNQYERVQEYEEKINDLENRVKDLEDQIDEAMEQMDMKVKDMENEMTEERTRIVSEEDLEVKRGPGIGDYFMVVGSFRIEQNSYNFQEDLKRRGYDAGVVYDKKRKWYYVYIAEPKELKKGLEDLYKLREEVPEFHDAWIHIMSKSMR